ncbi:MAG TPA: hypothetical protein VHM70_27360 [Polyangiaceae bacterium]|nr:hypothetical protein [Polyangiaceae bacterium]
MNISVIELGTTSFQLLQARRTDARRVEPLYADKRYFQLSAGAQASAPTSEALQSAVSTLREVLATAPPSARAGGVVVIATGTVREALTHPAWSEAFSKQTGLTVRLLSGEEEARLSYWGAVSELSTEPQKLAVVDLGGATTAMAWGTGERVDRAASVRLGVLTLAERLAQMPKPGQLAIEQMAVFVRRTFEPLVPVDDPLKPDMLVFASGVAKLLLSLVYSYGLIFNGKLVPTDALHRLVPRLLTASVAELSERGVPEPRIPSVGPTAVVLSVIADLFEVERFLVGSNGLREGAVLAAEQLGLQAWPAELGAA